MQKAVLGIVTFLLTVIISPSCATHAGPQKPTKSTLGHCPQVREDAEARLIESTLLAKKFSSMVDCLKRIDRSDQSLPGAIRQVEEIAACLDGRQYASMKPDEKEAKKMHEKISQLTCNDCTELLIELNESIAEAKLDYKAMIMEALSQLKE